MNKRTAQGFALMGTVLLQASAVPAIIQALRGGETAPLATLALIALGLICCMVTEWHYKLWAYFIGSMIGCTGHVSIILLVLFR
jgi:hypothetical protein